MNKIIFDIQRFTEDNSGDTASDALELMHSIIQRFDLKTVDDTKLQGGSSTLNSTLKFIGTFWGSLFFKKSTRTTEVNALTTMLAGTVSIVEDIYAIREEKNKNNPSEVLITAKAEDLISNFTSLTNAFQKLASGKNSFILSIVSSVVGLAANLVLSMDGLKEDEIEKINKSYVSLLQVSSAEIIKKFFSEGLADNLIKMPVSQILDNSAVKAEIRKQTATNFTKGSGPLGLIFAAITGVLNAANEYDSRVKKYTEDEIPEDITKHDARIDAIATFVHDTASYYAKGFDDTVFKWIQAGLSFIRGEDIPYYTDKNYVEVITDWFKTLNYENSGTSGDDKFYVLENKSMVYGDSGNDDIGNYGFSNVTIWGGHDDDTLGSYKTDSATPQMNSIFGGPGNDQISVYDKDSTIYGGTGKDFINVVGTNNEIFGDEEDDKFYIVNGANNNTLSGDNGDDFIVMLEEAKNTIIKYASGDGNDTIYGFNEDDSLKISDSYKTTVDGNHLKITVGEGSILLVDMAGKNININGKTIKSGEENSTVAPVPPPEFLTLPATVASPFIYGTEDDDTIQNERSYVMIRALGGKDSIQNSSYRDSNNNWHYGGSNITISGGADDDSIYNSGRGVNSSISGGDGNDSIENSAYYVTINGDNGRDSIYNNRYGDNSSISGGDGDDTISNGDYYTYGNHDGGGNNVTITSGAGNDSIKNYGYKVSINLNTGNDSIENYGSYSSISGGEDNDRIYNSYYSDNSTISGDTGADIILNNGGKNVSINGDAGNDSIDNRGGNNVTIIGGDDNDEIVNDASNVTITGGAGNDLITYLSYSKNINILTVYNKGDGNDVIWGFKADSTLSISGGSYSTTKSNYDIIVTVGEGKISLIGAASLDAVNIDGEEENLTNLTFNNKTDSNVTLPAQTETVDASERTKPIKITGNTLANSLFGGKGNDTLDGTEGNNTLTGGKGNDIFIYNGGNDTITDYEKGKDKISLDSASISNFTTINKDVILALNNNNSLTLNNMADKQISFLSGSKTTKIAFTSNASLDGSAKGATLIPAITEFSAVNYSKLVTIKAENVSSAVNIIGNNKANRIIAGNHGSTLNGGKGKDSLIGGNGSDIFIYENKSGNKIIQNYTSSDAISLVGAQISDIYTKNKDVVLKAGSKKITVKDAANQEITINENGTTKFFIDNILYDEEKTSATLSSKFFAKDEKIFDSTISYINASNAKKKLNIVASATDGATIKSGKGKDTLISGIGNDSISGGKGKDILRGGAGADSLWGGKGNDTLYGGEDDDTFVFYAGEGNDVIADYASGDMLQIMNKKGTGYADFKKATFKDETLTLNINGGGKLILSGVNGDAFININGENNKISSLLK